MSTKGKKWTRKDRKWSDEITEFVKSVCPLREHGINSRRELAEEINRRFDRDFTERALCSHCYDNGIQLGLCYSNSEVARGEKHWRHRPVGSFQEKKGYIRIKVAEPNKWMQYQRYVWEQNHPGQSAEGKTVIFMDGNTRNFDPSNLECVERGELSVMAELGCTAESSREERELYLLRSRLVCAKSKMLGPKEAAKRHNKMNYERRKNDPEVKVKRAAYAKQRLAEIMADPVRHQEYLEKQRAYREKNRLRVNQWAKERRAYLKNNEPEKYQAKLAKERAKKRKVIRVTQADVEKACKNANTESAASLPKETKSDKPLEPITEKIVEPKQELKPICPAIVVDRSKDEIQTVKLTKENEKELDNMAVNDPVNHPSHYQGNGVECIDCIKSAVSGLDGFHAFCAGNAIKYIFRFSHKNGVEDLRKAEWYIDRLIKAIPGRHE